MKVVVVRLTINLLGFLLLLHATASAGTIVVIPDSTREENVWIQADDRLESNSMTGVLKVDVTLNGIVFHRDVVCVDLFRDIIVNTSYNANVLTPDEAGLGRVAWLVDNTVLPVGASTYKSALGDSFVIHSGDRAQAAGLQLAVWDIVHDDGDGFASGRVQASTQSGSETDPTALQWASNYLAVSNGRSSDRGFVYYNTDSSGNEAQMLIGPDFETPEPATLSLAGAALAGLLFAAGRKRAVRK